ncbi:MAG: hypothetical protein LBM92_08710, partial [Opitutaceae bacterium]|nr:hypothetical protein [Opitutaceae bacterium]
LTGRAPASCRRTALRAVGNRAVDRSLVFPPVTTSAFRLLITKSPGGRARIRGVRPCHLENQEASATAPWDVRGLLKRY